MRKRVIAGNWKMHTDMKSGPELAGAVMNGIHGIDLPEHLEIALCPPFPLLHPVYAAIGGSRIKLGAQNVHNKKSGAFTGEVSAPMLKSIGCTYVIVGHSERRLMFAESDSNVCYKVNAVLDTGLSPIVCVGETEAERELGRVQSVIERQLRAAFDGVFDFNVGNCVIAYEPVWAIGTGKNATPEEAQEVHAFIRELIATLYNRDVANGLTIQYGGSVKASNAASLFAQPDIDGALVGGASLEAAEFLDIVRAAA